MKLGISTACYYPMKTEEALAAVVEGGAPCTELFLNSFSEMTPQYRRELRAILAGGVTQVISVHPFTCGLEPMLFFGDYPRRFTDGLELYKQYFQTAAELGAGLCIFHGAIAKRGVTQQQYLDSFGRLDLAAKEFGVRMGQENVGRCVSRDPRLFRLLRGAIPDAAFVLDIKQTYRSDGTAAQFLEAMGPNVVHLHLSDGTPEKDCLPVGEGSFDFRWLFGRLKQNGCTATAILELYRDSYAQEGQLWDSLKKLQEML